MTILLLKKYSFGKINITFFWGTIRTFLANGKKHRPIPTSKLLKTS